MSAPARRRYEVLEVLGEGGFGTVYAARLQGDGGFSKRVALKVLRAGVVDQPELAARLRDEARILGLLRHRALVQVDDLVQLDGRWTVVMELVDGVDVGAPIAVGPVPPRAALEIVQEAANALHVAWTSTGPDGRPLHILHRDIKPGNLLVTANGEVKLLDFGIARAEFDSRESHTRSISYGSPQYMSPERLEWENGPESDVYALGCVLVEMLIGRPFGISSGHPDRHQRKIDEVVAELQPGLPPGGEPLLELVGRMLAHDRAARPTARELDRLTDAAMAAVGGPRLRDWAEAAVPLAREQRARPPTGDTPRILEERSTAHEAPPPPPPPRTSLPVWLVAGASAALMFTVGAAGLLWLTRDRWSPPPEPPPRPPPEITHTPPPDPIPEVPTPIEAPEAPIAEVPQTPSARPTRPAPAPAPATTGRVSFSGDATAVSFAGGGRTYDLPAELPAGDYTATVTFPERDPVATGRFTVPAGGQLHLVCDATFKRCSAR